LTGLFFSQFAKQHTTKTAILSIQKSRIREAANRPYSHQVKQPDYWHLCNID